MSDISLPITLKAGQVITETALRENFDALAAGLSDGTKDLSVATATVASNATAGALRVTGDASVSGEATGEKSLIPLFGGVEAAFANSSRYILWDGSDSASGQRWVAPRAGSIVGYSYGYGHSSAGSSSVSYSVPVSKISTGTTVTVLFTTGTLVLATATTATGLATTITRNVASFTTGDGLYARLYVATAVSFLHHSMQIEVQWD